MKAILVGSICAVFSLSFSHCSVAQNRITGLVRTSDGKPLPFATVMLLVRKDSSLVKGGIATEDGKFTIETTKNGSHLIVISMVGYQKVYSIPFVLGSVGDVNLPPFVLEDLAGQLGEVSVKAQKPFYEQQTDRLIVNVANSISAAGGNALDILERSPGVMVNQQAGTIGMNGKVGVMVMVNGKLSRMTAAELIQFLSGIPSNSIEKIELITNPPAKYDAEGNAGLINIVLKKNESEGSSGSLALTAGMGFRPKWNGTLSLNKRGPKASFYGDISQVQDYNKWRLTLDRNNVVDGRPTSLETEMNRLSKRNVMTARLGTEVYLSNKTSIVAQLSGFVNKSAITKERSTSILYTDRIPSTIVDIQRTEASVWKNLLGNIGLRHQFENKAELTVDADIVHYSSVQKSAYDNYFEYPDSIPSSSYERIDTDKRTQIDMIVIKADYTRQFEKIRFEAGLKGTFSSITNDIILERSIEGEKYVDPDFTSDYLLNDYIGAGYLNISGSSSNKKLKWQAGFRTEYTHTHLYSQDDPAIVLRKYFAAFPSVSGSWQATPKSQYQIAYSRRVTRPEYTQIAPFIAFYGWENFGSGNAKLKAAFTDNIQTSYVFKNSYMFTLGFSRQKDAIIGYQARIDTIKNRFYSNPENIDQIRTWSATVFVPLKLTTWWQLQTSVQYAFQQVRTIYQGERLRLDKGFWQLSGQQSFSLPHGFNADITFSWISKIWQGIGLNPSYGGVNVGIQKKLAGNNGTLRLAGTDLFRTNRGGFAFNYPDINLDSRWDLKWDTRVVRLTYSRNFGNNRVKASRRTTGSEDDRKRITF